MLLALATLGGCWRPDPYVPPEAPVEAAADERTEEPPAPDAAEPEVEGTPPEDTPDPEDIPVGDPEDVPSDEGPAFQAYPARTVQAPVTIVDDYGKPLAVLTKTGVALEVRGEEPIRTRVWCSSCAPPAEGWLQPHLLKPE